MGLVLDHGLGLVEGDPRGAKDLVEPIDDVVLAHCVLLRELLDFLENDATAS